MFEVDKWIPVCSSGWDQKDVVVVCQSMGFQNGRVSEYPLSEVIYIDILLTGKMLMKRILTFSKGIDLMMRNVQCTGSEEDIFACDHDGFKQGQCKTLAGVNCEN